MIPTSTFPHLLPPYEKLIFLKKKRFTFSHPTLHLSQQRLQLILLHLRLRPPNAQPLLLIRLGDNMKVHMINQLMRRSPIVLQNIVVNGARGLCDALGHAEDLRQVLVGDVRQLDAVVFGDHELFRIESDWLAFFLRFGREGGRRN